MDEVQVPSKSTTRGGGRDNNNGAVSWSSPDPSHPLLHSLPSRFAGLDGDADWTNKPSLMDVWVPLLRTSNNNNNEDQLLHLDPQLEHSPSWANPPYYYDDPNPQQQQEQQQQQQQQQQQHDDHLVSSGIKDGLLLLSDQEGGFREVTSGVQVDSASRLDWDPIWPRQQQQQQQQQQHSSNYAGSQRQLVRMPISQPNSALFDYCVASTEGGENANPTELLRCVAGQLSNEPGTRSFSRSVLLVYAGALVFFMQAGFAMVCAGAVRKKNVQNTMLKNLLDACGASVAFFSVGYAFAFGGGNNGTSEKTFIGNTNFFLMGVDDYSFWFFQYAFSAASATIVAGTLAERCQMVAYLCYSVMLTGWVYPIIVHAIWNSNGFLSAFSPDPLWGVGMVDFAGSGVVHTTGGVTALFATMILGPRRGRFHDETGRRLEKPRDFPGHSTALQMLGTIILWFGWYGFNCGSALTNTNPDADHVAALAAVNTTMSGGTAGLIALFGNLWYLERYTGEPFFDLKYAMNGCLCGLVAITAGCGVVEPWAAALTGVVSGIIYIVGSRLLVHLRLDDAVDAIPVHMFNGMWGLIAVGLFASPQRLQVVYHRSTYPGFFYSLYDGNPSARLLGVQLTGMLFIIGWVMCIMLPFFIWLDWRGWFRSDPLEEIVGLDTSYHGGLALLGGDEAVNPEYVSAFKKKKLESLSQRYNGGGGGGSGEFYPGRNGSSSARSRRPIMVISETVIGDSYDGKNTAENDGEEEVGDHPGEGDDEEDGMGVHG